MIDNAIKIEHGIVPIAKIFEAEKILLQMPQLKMKVVHHFSDGLYARELHIPKGTLLTGAIHRFQNLNILSQGEISVSTSDGMKHIKAPFTIISPAGTKRIAIAHEDCIWTTFFPTTETDPEKIVEQFTTNNVQEYLLPNEISKLEEEQSWL